MSKFYTTRQPPIVNATERGRIFAPYTAGDITANVIRAMLSRRLYAAFSYSVGARMGILRALSR